METRNKIILAAIVIVAAVSLESCSVEYRARHPRRVRHKRVIVVGMTEPKPSSASKTIAFKTNVPVDNLPEDYSK
ncbi:MAG TPA: hypothetical protein PLP23_11500 [Panacibacter sp.]|nr:hypothetical protein [Panacibacter sp.]